ncbi:hypothetical protein [Streptomyces apocyni]|uniref:hypothetical protein n=1 Tax=Streptomyces apocyni TaxID=2654677 RepID=UPI001E4DBD93|nr:hypothetical protein [Streptomyces apocyni]
MSNGPQETPRGESGGPSELSEPGGPSGLGPDELALRRLLHEAVQQVEPSEGALDHLRRAVPARRARKRQALVGAAAAALFLGTAIPALIHVTDSPSGSSTANPSAVGHSSSVPGGSGESQESGAPTVGGSASQGQDAGDQAQDGGKGKDKDGQDKDSKEKGKGDQDDDKDEPGEGSSSGAAQPAESEASSVSTCIAGQLGNATANSGEPGETGKVYGAFQITNVSDSSCAVGGDGSLVFTARGQADPEKISVTDHQAGGVATRLPDPPQERSRLVLQPGASFRVEFGWVPSQSCPSPDPSPDPSPTDDDSADVTGGADGESGGGGGTEQSGTEAQLAGDADVESGRVRLTYTAEPGSPSLETTIPNACAGTIYRTGVLGAS